MAKSKRTAREEIERAFHVSFKLPEQARTLLDQYRDQVLTEAAGLIQQDQQAREAAELAKYGFLDHETELQTHAITQAAQVLLNARTAKET